MGYGFMILSVFWHSFLCNAMAVWFQIRERKRNKKQRESSSTLPLLGKMGDEKKR